MVPLVALVATGGCFATRSDVRIVQTDVASLRAEMVKNDAERRESLAQALRLLMAANDSLARISRNTMNTQGDVRGEMREVKDQLAQVQVLIGQLQSSLTRFRSDIEERTNAMTSGAPAVQPPVSAPPAGTSATGRPGSGGSTTSAPPTTPPLVALTPADSVPKGPGPTQLYTNGMDQAKRGSVQVARTLFQDLLSNYPNNELAPDAQFQIAVTHDREKNLAAADVAYAAVVAKYPESKLASTALFKRAQIAVQQGNTADARRLYNEVISKYPKSDEAEFAADGLKRIR
jgi:tol-pal system protein YbgF